MDIEEIRTSLAGRLRARRGEIEQVVLTRIRAVSDSGESTDPGYRDGLRAAVSAALEYGIGAVERRTDHPQPMPTVLLVQARLAARHGVRLETVLRRYVAGHTLFADFLIEESESGGSLNGASLKRLLRAQAALLDRLVAAVGEEYARELTGRHFSVERRRVERVKQLLDGELIDTAELRYPFETSHVGVVAEGAGADETVRRLAATLDCRLLLVSPFQGVVWAWLGGRWALDSTGSGHLPLGDLPDGTALAVGEASPGIAGWRLTHLQAAAALPVARRGGRSVVRYADVALLAAILQDDLLASSLRQLYLEPLEDERDHGATLRATLRAYLAANGSLSSAAVRMNVSPRTIGNRLRRVEEIVGRPVHSALAEIDSALRLEELDATGSASRIRTSGLV